jgi:hypothetical protein
MQNKVDTVNISAAYTEFLLNFMANRAPEAAVGEEAIIIATILTISFIGNHIYRSNNTKGIMISLIKAI